MSVAVPIGRLFRDCCPLCSATTCETYLHARDMVVSGEEFSLERCVECGFVFTQNAPNEERIGPYYESPSYVPHAGASKNVIALLRSSVRYFTIRARRSHIQRLLGKRSGTLLEIGSGTGDFSALMRRCGWQVTAVESSDRMKAYSQEHFGFAPADPSILSAMQETFDAIILWHVLEHIHDFTGMIATIKRLLGSQGVCLIAAPNYHCADAEAMGSAWPAYDVPRHLWHFTPDTMRRLLGQHGLQVVSLRPQPIACFYLVALALQNRTLSPLRAIGIVCRATLQSLWRKEQAGSIVYIIRHAP